MYLKRVYHSKEVEKFRAEAEAWEADPKTKPQPTRPSTVVGVKILSCGDFWNASPRIVEKGKAEGWITFEQGILTVHNSDGEDAVFRVPHGPGHYCCHCDAALDGQVAAQMHVIKEHDGEESPDGNNPSGYRKDNFYRCVLVTDATRALDDSELADYDLKARQALCAKLLPNQQKRQKAHQAGKVYK